MKSKTANVFAAAGLLATAGLAVASIQPQRVIVRSAPDAGGDGHVAVSADVHPHPHHDAADTETGGSYVIVTKQDGKTYELKLENKNDMVVKVDGVRVGPDRVHAHGNVVVVTGKDGTKLHEFKVGGPAVDAPPALNFQWAQNDGFAAFIADGTDRAAPPVMIGINLSEPSAALRYHVGINADFPAILVDRVIEGLPAAKAGIKQFDVIVGLDGKKGASGEMLREALSKKDPGDKFHVLVARGGDREKVVVKLSKYDGSKLGIAAPHVEFGRDYTVFGGDAVDEEIREHHRELIERTRRHLHDLEVEIDEDEIAELIHDAMDKARQGVFQLKDGELLFHDHDFEFEWDFDAYEAMIDDELAGIEDEMEDRLGELEDRLAELEDRLADRLDDLFDRIEEMIDDDHQ